MKQVIIIGNGFDIAHGLQTSFKDFSEFLLEEILIPDLEHLVLKTVFQRMQKIHCGFYNY